MGTSRESFLVPSLPLLLPTLPLCPPHFSSHSSPPFLMRPQARLDLQQLQQRLFQAAGEGKEGRGGEEQAAVQAKLEAAREQLRKAQVCTSQNEMGPLLLGLRTRRSGSRPHTHTNVGSHALKATYQDSVEM